MEAPKSAARTSIPAKHAVPEAQLAPPGAKASKAPDAPASPEQGARLYFAEIDGQALPYPLLRATVRGEETLLIADTAATHHVLASWLVKKLVISTSQSDVDGRGHLGALLDLKSAQNAGLEILDVGSVGLQSVLVADMPPPFEMLGFGGIASPQALSEGEAVVMDLGAGTLAKTDQASALAGLVGRGPWLARCVDCTCQGRPPNPSHATSAAAAIPRAPVFIVPAIVGGHAVRLAVDTGAAHTDLRLRSSAGAKLARRSTKSEDIYTADGRYTARTVSGLTVKVGELQRQLDVDLIPSKPNPDCPSDGSIGMDVLAGCSLVMTSSSFAARCPAKDEADDDLLMTRMDDEPRAR
jgi:predicted aspartyl protease